MNLWLVIPGSIVLVALGIALEVALSFSQDRQGARSALVTVRPRLSHTGYRV